MRILRMVLNDKRMRSTMRGTRMVHYAHATLSHFREDLVYVVVVEIVVIGPVDFDA